MRLLLALLVSVMLSGCATTFLEPVAQVMDDRYESASAAVDVRLLDETYNDGRAHLKYEVQCRDGEWYLVDYYGNVTFNGVRGFVFKSKEAILQQESKFCRSVELDGDTADVDDDSEE